MTHTFSENKWFLKAEQAVLILLLFSIFLAPPIHVNTTYPALQVSDILLPLIWVFLFLSFEKIFIGGVYSYALVVIFFGIYIFITMVINDRILQTRDYFEILKMVKFISIILFITLNIKRINYMRIFRMIFIILLVFNLFQYVELFNFNDSIEPYYSTPEQVDFFGLNSLGQPDTKRLLGTMGNPNNNAILFLFFCVIFVPHENSKPKDWAWFLLAYLLFLICQSRTGVIAFTVFTGLTIWFFKYDKLKIIILVLSIIGGFCTFKAIEVFHSSNESYIESIGNPQKMAETKSVTKRLEIWNLLWQMIKQKPVFGHAPSKEFFYENHLHSESEYVLMTWRYGFTGLILYMVLVLFPWLKAFKFKESLLAKQLILFTVIILVTALTNNPLSNPAILLMFAVIIGLFYSNDRTFQS